MPKHITLIGMMGAGKSSVAPLIASRLNREVIEVDALIEEQEGMPIGEIFIAKGEAYFRRAECAMIAELLKRPPAVLSLGGGAFMWEATRELLLKETIVIYLSASLEVLHSRLQASQLALRPLLNAPGIDIEMTIRELLERRGAYYGLAHYRVETDSSTPDEVARALVTLREAYETNIWDAAAIKGRAAELGLDACGITSVEPTQRAALYREWIEAGRAGEMQWLLREPERRTDPRLVLPGAGSVIVAGLNYWQESPRHRGRIARYALGDDYHEVLLEKLETLAAELTTGGARAKVYVDTGPVLEKPLAQRAGLGWQGKSTMLIHPKLGPWLLLGEIITTLELAPDAPERDHCGTCTRCLGACPTGAITAPYQLDARRCIAYLTIELKGSIPEELRPLIGDRVYGCDECLDVCPWNRFAQTTRESRFLRKEEASEDPVRDLLEISGPEFKRRYARSPILRVKRRGLLRNVCVVLGNIGTEEDLPALRRAELHDEPLVREHAAWAVREILKRQTAATEAKDQYPVFSGGTCSRP